MIAHRFGYGLRAANADAAYHDLWSALKVLTQAPQLPFEQFDQLVQAVETHPRTVGEMTVNQLIALIQSAQGGAA